jgi:hypothetical protein
MQDAYNQAKLGAAQQAYQSPWSNLANFQQTLQGWGGGTGTSTNQTPYYTNPLATLGGLGMGAAGVASMMSDRRLKADIERIGTHRLGFGIYRYRYLKEKIKRVGVMAQEVLPVLPSAVLVASGGYFAVDYAQIGALA